MISEKGISGKSSAIESLDFENLRERGIKITQALSGGVWTDYNLHDPGVTILEILCYALTDVSYRAQQLKDALQSDKQVPEQFIDRYFFNYQELISSLPLTQVDFEKFIEKTHNQVKIAWVTTFPLMTANEVIKGGYEISILLQEDPYFKDLNSDVLEVIINKNETKAHIILFNEENKKLEWEKIISIRSCKTDPDAPDSFFQFEMHNCQVLLELEIKKTNKRIYENKKVKARISVTASDRPLSANTSISRYKNNIIKVLESDDFMDVLKKGLKKEHHKQQVLGEIRNSLLPLRNLCEDFKTFKVVSIQEIKIDVTMLLTPEAKQTSGLAHRVYHQIDQFLFSMVEKAKKPGNRGKKNVLYSSNIIERLSLIKDIEAVQLHGLNLYVDGIPTISLQEESVFDCIQLQNFSLYAPKVSREKSSITFLQSGTSNTFRVSEVSTPFTPRSLQDLILESHRGKIAAPETDRLTDNFFQEIREFFSIQEDFPQNYRLTPGKIPEKAPPEVRSQQKRFKAYLLFYDRILMEFLERLFHLNEQLSLNQNEEVFSFSLDEILQEKHPDIKELGLLLSQKETQVGIPPEKLERGLAQKNKILDHLLARFAIKFENLETAAEVPPEEIIEKKIRLLKDIPVITRERGLGLPLLPEDTDAIWGGSLLSGLQKRVYRLLGIGNEGLTNTKLTSNKEKETKGFYMVEHLLLVEKEENQVFDKKLNQTSSLLIDFLEDLAPGNTSGFSYSSEISLLIPNWYTEWSNKKGAYEEFIRKEVPAHILPNIYWLDKKSMKGFEILYEDWLKTILQVHKQ